MLFQRICLVLTDSWVDVRALKFSVFQHIWIVSLLLIIYFSLPFIIIWQLQRVTFNRIQNSFCELSCRMLHLTRKHSENSNLRRGCRVLFLTSRVATRLWPAVGPGPPAVPVQRAATRAVGRRAVRKPASRPTSKSTHSSVLRRPVSHRSKSVSAVL